MPPDVARRDRSARRRTHRRAPPRTAPTAPTALRHLAHRRPRAPRRPRSRRPASAASARRAVRHGSARSAPDPMPGRARARARARAARARSPAARVAPAARISMRRLLMLAAGLRGAFPGALASALTPGNRRERSPGTQAHRVLTRAPTNGGQARRSRGRHSDSRLSTDLSSPLLRELPNRSDLPEARRKCSHSRAAALPPTGQAKCTTLPDPSRFQRAGPAHVVLRQPGRPARDDREALSQRGISRVKKAAGCRRRTVDRRFPRQ